MNQPALCAATYSSNALDNRVCQPLPSLPPALKKSITLLGKRMDVTFLGCATCLPRLTACLKDSGKFESATDVAREYMSSLGSNVSGSLAMAAAISASVIASTRAQSVLSMCLSIFLYLSLVRFAHTNDADIFISHRKHDGDKPCFKIAMRNKALLILPNILNDRGAAPVKSMDSNKINAMLHLVDVIFLVVPFVIHRQIVITKGRKVNQIVNTFDKTKATRFTCAIPASVGSKFSSLEHKGVSSTASDIVGGFFVPFFHQLVDWVWEALSLLGSLCDQSTNLHSIRLFSFSSEFGGNTHREVQL